jgi:hypothetical protein
MVPTFVMGLVRISVAVNFHAFPFLSFMRQTYYPAPLE